MAPKKPPKPNAYSIFVQELMKQHGRRYNSTKEAYDAAAPLWAAMDKNQKRPYEEKAKELKNQIAPSRYTSEGLDVEELTREEEQKNQLEEMARQQIRNIISFAHKKGEDVLASETFFLIHCNIFCYYAPSDRYFPAEIAVLSFSLKDGVKADNVFWYQVKPGRLPIGYKFEAKQHSDETHLLPVPFDSDTDDNQEEIYFSLKAFIEKKKSPGTRNMPILFTEKKYSKMIQRILNTWSDEYDNGKELFRIYNLQVMFHSLRNTVACEPVWSSITFADRELEKDVYAYNADIACQIHAATSKPLFCSQSVVKRYVYVICDNCCPDLNIELIPGQHVPIESTILDTGSSYGGSSVTSRSSKSLGYGGRKGRGFDSDFDTESNADTWDKESIVSTSSTVTTLNDHYPPLGGTDQFPSLGRSKSQSQNSDLAGFTPQSGSSVKSYAGATGRSTLPAAFERSIENMSLSSGPPKGRGFRRRTAENDSDTSSVGGGAAVNILSTDSSDFPPIGGRRGRGFTAQQVRKPGIGNNK